MGPLKRIVVDYLQKWNLKRGGNKFINHQYVGHTCVVQKSSLGGEVRIGARASVKNSTVGYLTSIGRNTKITHSQIGKYCAISWDCTINAISHPMTKLSVSAFPYVPQVGGFVSKRVQEHQVVTVGNDVWIGTHVVIMPGISVGNGAVLAAGAIVTKDVPAYAVVAGVPAKVIKYRFNENIIKQLEEISWWDFDKSIIKKNISLFQGEVDELIIAELKKLSAVDKFA